ncbi:MAG TPA: ATP-dependent DNA ligase [Candidatus Babeliales bacterium]|nr:ATP-dependent DNA ligase [Candidatus Babeliales bacterium]
MHFVAVAQQFQQLEVTSSRTEMTKILADIFKHATPAEISILSNLSLGMLRPPYKGTQFNFAEKNLFGVIAQLIEKTEKEVAAEAKRLGDVGLVVTEYGKWKPEKELTVTHVYESLCAFEHMSGKGSQEEKAAHAVALLKQVSPLEAKFIIRIILGTLRLGFSDMTIIDAYSWMTTGDKSLHKDIEEAYNTCVDIGLIGQKLKADGVEAVRKMKIEVGIPVRPAAAERMPTAKDIYEKLGDCIAQPKLDGFRLQIHIDKRGKEPRVEFFSRNLIDMSHMFPDLVKAFSQLPVETMICEGEAISFDPNTGIFLPFQETVKRKRKHGIEEAITDYPLRIYLFDLLYLNGKDVLADTHEQRRTKLLGVLKNKDDVIFAIDEKKINSTKELETYFLHNIEQGLEGLVVKRPDAIYQPGKRNFNWIKLKKHTQGHLEDTIDCVILGYYAGSGKRAHFGVGAFLVGIYNKDIDGYQTVAKIGTGMTDDEWKDLKHKCDKIKVHDKPKNVHCAKELFPDVWVNPEIVCAVLADEITESPLHTAAKTEHHLGYALRFPRFMGYRPDKKAEDATSVNEIKRLYEDQFGKK